MTLRVPALLPGAALPPCPPSPVARETNRWHGALHISPLEVQMRLALLALGVLLVAGCNKKESGSPAPGGGTPAAPAKASSMPGHSGIPGAAPIGEVLLTGKVAEVLNVPGYTYLRLTTASGETWAAVPTATVAVGTEVSIKNPMRMEGFESKTLNRKFDVIMFGGGLEGAGVTSPAQPPAMASAPLAPPAAVDTSDIKVEKATGPDAKTIAEIYAQRATLKGRSVTVRGKVVKYSTGILERNWIHLRDGTGTPEGKDNDITVTTNDTTAKGEVIVVKGVVHLDKDIGAGYTYAVLIEDAHLTK